MAYTKILVVHGRLDKSVSYAQNKEKTSLKTALDYALNRNKTERTCFETAINCDRERVYEDMMATKQRWGKEDRKRKGYHIIQSFAPGEVTPEQAHEIGVELVQRLLSDKYEAVVATHLDKAHLHSHIVFNSVSFVDGYMYRDTMKDYFVGIRGTSDTICREHGLSIIESNPDTPLPPKNRPEWTGKVNVRDTVRIDIDHALQRSTDLSSLLRELRYMGYTIHCCNQKYISMRPPGGNGNIRLDSLGAGYTEDDLKNRLSDSSMKTVTLKASTISPLLTPGKRYRLKGDIPYHHSRKLRGFQALCYKYLYLLRRIRQGHPQQKRVSLSLRQEVAKFDRYQRQFLYLHRNRLETAEQVSMQYDALQAEIDCLTERQKELYAQRRAGNETVSLEISTITERLRLLRRELRLCLQIESDVQKMRAEVNTQQQNPNKALSKTKLHRRSERGRR